MADSMPDQCPDCDLPRNHVGACVESVMTFVCDRLIITDDAVRKLECPHCKAVGQMLVLKSPRDAMAECSKCRWKITLDTKD